MTKYYILSMIGLALFFSGAVSAMFAPIYLDMCGWYVYMLISMAFLVLGYRNYKQWEKLNEQ